MLTTPKTLPRKRIKIFRGDDNCPGIKTPASEEIDLVNLGRWSERVYHRFDYAFFFNNLTENVAKRIDAYLSTH